MKENTELQLLKDERPCRLFVFTHNNICMCKPYKITIIEIRYTF